MRQLIVDYLPFEVRPEQITESMKKNDGKLIVRGVLQRAEAENQNGRIYPKEILEREASKYAKEFIAECRAMGELDHPESSVVNLQNVSHIIREAKWEGDDVIGIIEILPTPTGNILTSLFENGITIGVSSRGMGSLNQIGETLEVQDDFELLCWDFVSTPSTPGAYVSPLQEGLEAPQDPYQNVSRIITDILCSKGNCPIL